MVGSTRTSTLTVFLIVATIFTSAANAALLSAYDLVGEDPAGDSHNYSAPGVDTGQFNVARTDILGLEMAHDGDMVQFKLNIAALPSGTGGYQYAVHFTVGETAMHVCWNQQWTGGQAAATQQNSNGCNFAGETRKGPTTTGATLEAGTADEKTFIRWEVAKADIEDPGADKPITKIWADTWFRGINPTASGCPTSSQTRCTWLQSDRGPDAGEWAYSLTPAAPPLSLSFSMEPKNATVGPAETVSVSLMPNLTGNGSVAFNWSIPDLPAGWNATFDVPNGTLAGGENVTHSLTILVPDDATNQTANLTVLLTAENNLTASANLTITVDTTLGAPPLTASPSGSESASPSDNATAAADDDNGIPNVGLVLSTIGLIAVAVALRGRRKD